MYDDFTITINEQEFPIPAGVYPIPSGEGGLSSQTITMSLGEALRSLATVKDRQSRLEKTEKFWIEVLTKLLNSETTCS